MMMEFTQILEIRTAFLLKLKSNSGEMLSTWAMTDNRKSFSNIFKATKQNLYEKIPFKQQDFIKHVGLFQFCEQMLETCAEIPSDRKLTEA